MKLANSINLYLMIGLLPIIAIIIASWARRRRMTAKLCDAELLPQISDEISITRRVIKDAALILAIALLILALARPQWGYSWEESRSSGVDIMIAIDTSRSMQAADLSPNRLTFAKRKITDLLASLHGERVGLIAFAARAYILTPLTQDYSAIKLFTDSIDENFSSEQGTSIGEAIALATKGLTQSKPEGRSILIISDGEDLGSDLDRSIAKAKEAGIKLFFLGVGTPDGAPIPKKDGGFIKGRDGSVVITHLTMEPIAEVANGSGGLAIQSAIGNLDLSEILKRVRGVEVDSEQKNGMKKRFTERFQLFIFTALLLLLVHILLSDSKGRRNITNGLISSLIAIILFSAVPNEAVASGGMSSIKTGERLYAEGKYDEALNEFLSSSINDPDDLRLKYNLASTYYRLGQFDKAQELLSDIASKDKGALKGKSLYNLGNSLYREGKFEEAIKAYEDTLAANPKDEDAAFNLELAKKQLAQKKEDKKDDGNKDGEKKKDDSTNDSQQNDDSDAKKNDTKEGSKNEDGENSDQINKENSDKPQSEQSKSEKDSSDGSAGEDGLSPSEMSKEQAKRILSGIREGKRRSFSDEMKSDGHDEVKGEW